MKIPRPIGGVIDIRLVRRLLRGYVRYHRKKGRAHGWPDEPVDGAAKSPAELVRKFRKDIEYRTHRQRNWAARIGKIKLLARHGVTPATESVSCAQQVTERERN